MFLKNSENDTYKIQDKDNMRLRKYAGWDERTTQTEVSYGQYSDSCVAGGFTACIVLYKD